MMESGENPNEYYECHYVPPANLINYGEDSHILTKDGKNYKTLSASSYYSIRHLSKGEIS